MKKETFQKRGWNFAQVPAAVVCDPTLSAIDVRVYAYLLWRQGIDSNSFPGEERIAHDIGVSRATVARSIANLTANDLLRRKRRFSKSTLSWIFESRALCQAWDVRITRDTNEGNVRITGDTSFVSPVIRHTDNQIQINKIEKRNCKPSAEGVGKPKSTTREIQEAYAAACGYPVDWRAGNGTAAKWLSTQGYTAGEVSACYKAVKAQPFWKDKPLSLPSLVKQIGAWRQSGAVTSKVTVATDKYGGFNA